VVAMPTSAPTWSRRKRPACRAPGTRPRSAGRRTASCQRLPSPPRSLWEVAVIGRRHGLL